MKRKATIRLSIARTLLFATVALGAPALAQTTQTWNDSGPTVGWRLVEPDESGQSGNRSRNDPNLNGKRHLSAVLLKK